MPAGSIDFFNNVRVNSLAKGVYDPRLQPQPLIWDKRISHQPGNGRRNHGPVYRLPDDR